ncbi:MAG: hypothetical protein HZB53_02890 [Chloroflexi bacterium]|nr:hypothetical protein [Chloroflexota bacterium]
MKPPLPIEVVAYAPTGYYHCTHCEIVFKEQGIGERIHAEQLQSAMPADLMREYALVSQWITHLVERFGAQIAITVIDAASIEGVWKSLRWGLRRYPSIIVGVREIFAFRDAPAAEAAIARRIAEREPVGP